MNRQKSSNPGQARPPRAFQTDPSWYESYWYGSEQPSTPGPTQRRFAMLAALIPLLHRLIAERPAKRMPMTTLQGTS